MDLGNFPFYGLKGHFCLKWIPCSDSFPTCVFISVAHSWCLTAQLFLSSSTEPPGLTVMIRQLTYGSGALLEDAENLSVW